MCRSVCALFAYLFLIFVAVGVYSIWRAARLLSSSRPMKSINLLHRLDPIYHFAAEKGFPSPAFFAALSPIFHFRVQCHAHRHAAEGLIRETMCIQLYY